MSDFTKADGAKIQITFSEPLTGTVTGNQAHFTVTSQEYNYVPGGTLGAVTHTVTATSPYRSIDQAPNLAAGTLTDVMVTDGKLSLGVTT